ncbi:MAG: PEGA domain-containing protein, partial [Patescibacteria group bacterium]
TGEVIQNGLVYVDSAPDEAEIKINGKVHSDKTNTRFNLPAGNYDLQLGRDGYRAWQRKFELQGSAIERFNYPMLIPKDLSEKQVDTNATMGFLYSQSPDRKWLVTSENPELTSIKEYNLVDFTANKLPKTRSFAVPAGVFTKATTANKFEVVEWSNNNADFLVKHIYDGKTEFALVNRDEPTKSFNLKTLIGTDGEITLLDKTADKFLVLNKATGSLTQVNKKDNKSTQLLTGVLNYKSHGDDKILFARVSPHDKTKALISLLDNDKTYDVREIPLSENLPLDIASFDSMWYLAVGSEKEARTYIYEDFVKKSKGNPVTPVGPIRVIKNNMSASLKVGFSKNVRFISSFAGNDVSVYDLEDNRSYRY